MVARIAEFEFSAFPLGAFLRAARAGVFELLSFDRMITFCKAHGAKRVSFRLVKEWFPFGILRLLDPMDVSPVSVFVSIARLCKLY